MSSVNSSLPPSDFINYFESIYKERWPALLESLLQEERQVFRFNQWAQESNQFDAKNSKFQWWDELNHKNPERLENGLLDGYVMSPASIIAAQCLPVLEGTTVLDMCAAPGGKSLVLAEKLNGTGTLICNEYSLNRRQRLIQVMQQYVPREVREKHIWVKGLDGMAYGMRDKGIYDSILLDAPCSGERHLLENPAELKKWSRNRTQKLSQKQYGLLTSALLALSSKGYLLYSTCSISPLENDGVIDHLIKKKSDTFNVVQIERPHELAEPTEHGWIFLPDRSGFGPLYFCLLQKN